MTTYVERQEKQKIGEQRAAVIRLKNNRLGMNIFQVSWIMAFVAMIVVNWQLRFNYSQWPPAGVAPFRLALAKRRHSGLAHQFCHSHAGVEGPARRTSHRLSS